MRNPITSSCNACRALVVLIVAVAGLTACAIPAVAATHKLNASETALFKMISHHPSQGRIRMKLDPILCEVARERAKDMAVHSYFGHVDRLGRGPNRLVTRAGFTLPFYYDLSKSGNNIESIVATSGGTRQAFELWLGSPTHRMHVLGESAFYQNQEAIGVGVYQADGQPGQTYYVFLSAPENPANPQRVVVLRNPDGKVISRTVAMPR